MALEPTTSFYDQWLAAMQAGAAAPVVDPLQDASAAPIAVPVAPPPVAPPQQLGPAPIAPVAELATPTLPPPPEPTPIAQPGFDALAPSTWTGLPTPEMPPPEAALPMPEVDAITGVAATPPPGSIIQQAAPVVAPRSTAEPGQLSLTDAELVDLAHRDPIAYAKYNAQKDAELADLMRQRTAEIQKQDADRAEAEHRDMLAARKRADDMAAQLDADAAALANEKPKGYMDSVGNALGAVAGIILGAIGSSATGGKNVGIEMVNAQIERHIQAQRDEYNRRAGNIDRRTNAIARLREAGMSDYQAATTFRLAALGRAREQLLTEAQNYDPRGTAARHIAGSVLGMEQQMIASREAARQRNLDEGLKLAKEMREQQEAADKHAAARAKLAAGAGAGQRMPPEYFEAKGLRKPPIAMTDKEYKGWLATKRSSEELTKAELDTQKARGEETPEVKREREFGINGPDGKPLLDAGGKSVHGRDIAEANKITEQIADTDEVIRMMDEVLRLRKKHGWSSGLGASPEWRKMQANWAGVILKKKNIDELGVIAGPDMELMGKALGAEDPTSLRDPTPGIEQGRQNAVQGLHGRLRIKGVADNSLPQYPETWKKQAPSATAVDEAIKETMTPGDIVDDRADLSRAGFAAHMADLAGGAKAPAAEVRAKVQYLEDAAKGDGAEAAKARQGLAEIAKGSTLPMARDAAAQALRNLDASKAGSQ